MGQRICAECRRDLATCRTNLAEKNKQLAVHNSDKSDSGESSYLFTIKDKFKDVILQKYPFFNFPTYKIFCNEYNWEMRLKIYIDNLDKIDKYDKSSKEFKHLKEIFLQMNAWENTPNTPNTPKIMNHEGLYMT